MHAVTDDIDSCNTGETTVNTAAQLQYEFTAGDIFGSNCKPKVPGLPMRENETLTDHNLDHIVKYIGFIATLASPANISITVGGTAMAATFQYKPYVQIHAAECRLRDG